nr:amino acid ABC transporter substrate-binding protein [Chloroflexota bacterium]
MRVQGTWSRWLWLVLALGCWALAFLEIRTWFGGGTDPTWEQIQKSGVVRVGMDATYPPFEVQDEFGRFYGYDVDLVEELARRWGVRAEFINIHFDGLYDALLTGKCDLLVSALPYDETLTEDVLYSPSYFNAGLLLAVREGERRIASVNSLGDKRVGVSLGSAGHLEARRIQEQACIPLQIVPFASSWEALQALRAGEVNAAIVDSVSAYCFVHDPGGIRYLKKFLSDEQYVIAMRPDSGYLWKRIADELAHMKKEGFLLTLQEKWF